MTERPSLARLIWSWLNWLWERLPRTAWYVPCERCGRELGAAQRGEPGDTFPTRQSAEDNARAADWLIDDGKDVCPNCRTASEREQVPAS